MTTKLTHIDKDNLIAKLRAEIVALGTALVDANSENMNLRAQLRAKSVTVSPGKIAAAQQLATSKATAAQLVTQYGATNVMRKGTEYLVRTPNGAWHPVA